MRRVLSFVVLSTTAWFALCLSHAAASTIEATDAAGPAGISEVTTTWSVAVDDFNGDGTPDFLLGRHRAPARLYENEDGRFQEIDAGTFALRDRHDCAWADVDRDGLDDVYCTVGAVGGRIAKQNQLWIQRSDGSFVNRAQEFGVSDPYGRGRRVTFVDVNHDVYPDLFVGNTYPRKDEHRSPNRLFINVNGTHFREDRTSGLTRELGARCVQAVDADHDGWQDLLVCGKQGRPLKLYRNQHGEGFRDVTASFGISGKAESAQLVDMNADGQLDLVRVGDHEVRLQLTSGGAFHAAVYARHLQAGIWLAIGDANGDGRPDLYIVQTCGLSGANAPDLLLIHRPSTTDFVEATMPEADQGCGGFAAPIDYDGNGTTDFVVVNGMGLFHGDVVTGPVQLITMTAI